MSKAGTWSLAEVSDERVYRVGERVQALQGRVDKEYRKHGGGVSGKGRVGENGSEERG